MGAAALLVLVGLGVTAFVGTGFGVFVGNGVAVGTGVFVGNGLAVGAGVFVDGTGDAVAVGRSGVAVGIAVFVGGTIVAAGGCVGVEVGGGGGVSELQAANMPSKTLAVKTTRTDEQRAKRYMTLLSVVVFPAVSTDAIMPQIQKSSADFGYSTLYHLFPTVSAI